MQTISMAPPSVGEISPTTVMLNVTVEYPNSIEELKRMLNREQQLFFPEKPLVGNDLIKVWNIEDELEAEHKNRLGRCNHGSNHNNYSNQGSIPLHFSNSAKTFSFDPEDQLDEFDEEHYHLPLAEISFPINQEEDDDSNSNNSDNVDNVDNVDVDQDEDEDEDELFAHYSFHFQPRPSSDPLPESISVPCPPPPMSPLLSDRGKTHTVIIDDLDLGLGLNWGDEETETRPKPTRSSSWDHRKRHRRNHSHFDFRFE